MAIIGAGTAGLSAGCFAQMNGFQTTIFEMADTPGGLCTSWKRHGYLFDGSVAGLAGSAPGTPLYRLWQEIGVVDNCELYYGENFGHIQSADGRRVTIYADVDRLQGHLLAAFPHEHKLINEFANAIRSVLHVDPPFKSKQGLQGLGESIKAAGAFLQSAPAVMKYSKITIQQFADRANDPFLKSVLTNIAHFGGTDVPLLTVLLPLAYAHRRMAGIPRKGWLDFARSIEKRYVDLGGSVHYRSKVTSILIEDGQAKGVILENNETVPCDIVLSAADGRTSNYGFTGLKEEPDHTIFKPERISDQPMQINLGVTEDLSADDGPLTYLLSSPFSAGGKLHHKITVHHKFYDPDAAPKGKSAVTVFLDSSYSWWQSVANEDKYEKEKDSAAREVIQAIESHQPGFSSKIEVIDVSTPMSRERYTDNWMGAMQAFKPDRNLMSAIFSGGKKYAHKEIHNYYLAGQWAESWGGITTAAQSARKAVASICHQEGIKFRTTIPAQRDEKQE